MSVRFTCGASSSRLWQRPVVTVEEHLRGGGLGIAVIEALHDAELPVVPKVVRLGLPDEFVTGYGTRQEQLAKYGLTAQSIANAVVRARAQRARPQGRTVVAR